MIHHHGLKMYMQNYLKQFLKISDFRLDLYVGRCTLQRIWF